MSVAQPSLRVAVVVPGAAAAYELFDVAGVDAVGVRLAGPLLLEVGEEVTLRVSRGGASVDVQARVTGVERAGGDAISVVRFTDEGAAARVAALGAATTASAG